MEGHSRLTEEVGEALHQWSMVEIELATLFEVASEMPNHNAAQATMAAIVSFEARLQVCHAVLAFYELSDLHSRYWTRLFNRLSKKAKKRNELAHFAVISVEAEEGAPIWLLMPYFSLGQLALKHRRKGHIGDGLSAEQIRERAVSFHLLMEQVAWFRAEIQVMQGRLEANLRPVPGLALEIQNEAAPTPKGRPSPRQP